MRVCSAFQRHRTGLHSATAALQHHQLLGHAFAQITGRGNLFQHFQRFVRGCFTDFLHIGHAFFLPTPQIVECGPFGFHMRKIRAVQIGHRQFAEDIVQNGGGVLDAVIALHHACGFEFGKGKGIDEFLERYAILQADGNRDGEIIHHRAETRTFLVHIDKDFAKVAVFIFAGAQVNLVPADNCLLGIALAPCRKFFAMAFADLLDHHLFDDLFRQHSRFFLLAAGNKGFFGLFVILDQCRRKWLAQLGAVPIKRIGLDPQRPAEFIGLLAILDRGVIGHVDGFGNGPGDERLRRRHHVDMAFNTQITLAFFAAGVSAVKHAVVFFFQVRRPFQRHGAANVVIGGVDFGAGIAKVAQQVKRRIVQLFGRDTQRLGTEILAQSPLVEHEPDVKGRGQCRFDLVQFLLTKPVADQRGMVDHRRIADRAMPHSIGNDFLDLGRAIAQFLQCRRHRAVDDLEIPAAGQFLELYQREIRLDPGGIAIHHQADRAGRRNHRDLRISVAVLFAQGQGFVPGGFGQFDQPLIRATGVIQRHRLDLQPLVTVGFAISGSAMVADHPQHVVRIALITRKRPQLTGNFRGCGIGNPAQDRCQRTAQGAAFVAVIGIAHVHQQPADIGIAQPQCAEIIGQLRDFLAGELGHHHADFQCQRPQTGGVDIILGLELAVFQKGQQIHAGQVAGGIIQEHIFRTGVGTADRTIFGACVPGVDRIMELDARIGTGPGGMADLFPQFPRLYHFGHFAVGAVDQFPVGIIAHRLKKGIGDTDRIIGVLAGDRVIGLAVPVRVIGREFDAGIALFGIIQHPFDISLGNCVVFCIPDRPFQGVVHLGINRVFLFPVPHLDGGENFVQAFFMNFGTGHDRGNLLFLDHFPVDEFLDIGVVGIDNHHLGRAPGGATGFDRAGGPVTDFQEPHQARGTAPARKRFTCRTKR